MVSAFPTHDKLDPRIANPPKTPSCQDLEARKEMLALGGAGGGNDKRAAAFVLSGSWKPRAVNGHNHILRYILRT